MINQELNQVVKDLRSFGLKRYMSKKHAAHVWREKDYLDGTVDAGVIILPTRGCRWGRTSGCTMCGYVYDSDPSSSQGELVKKFEEAIGRLQGVEYLKIFNSGSFFDPKELSSNTRQKILSMVNGRGIRRVQVESRPEFLEDKALGEAKEASEAELEIGLGLETTNDDIRRDCINKNATLEDFKEAIDLCRRSDILVKAYLLLKPPFLTEREALRDAVNSAVEAQALGASRISFNPVNIQRGTLVEYLWKRGEYRPPWLWSVLEVLKETATKIKVPVLSHPTAAGRARGAHNCGRCDSEVRDAVMNFSITQDAKFLNGPACDCIDIWMDHLELEQLTHGVIAR
ncbi:MAG: archaeosine biosynthesis radical SAM protein RaSEA [Candidatus Hydrothermarchaeales archaeon]